MGPCLRAMDSASLDATVAAPKPYILGDSAQPGRAITEDFDVLQTKLGSGEFGDVFLGLCKETMARRAIKVIIKQHAIRERILTEVRILQEVAQLQHCNLLQLMAYYESDDTVHLVFELINGSTLMDMLDKRGTLPDGEARDIVRHISNGVQTLHSNHIVHRDLKLDNIMCADPPYFAPSRPTLRQPALLCVNPPYLARLHASRSQRHSPQGIWLRSSQGVRMRSSRMSKPFPVWPWLPPCPLPLGSLRSLSAVAALLSSGHLVAPGCPNALLLPRGQAFPGVTLAPTVSSSSQKSQKSLRSLSPSCAGSMTACPRFATLGSRNEQASRP